MEPSQIAAGFFIYAYLKQLKVTFVHNSLYLKYDVQNLWIIVQIYVEEIIRVSVWKIWNDTVFRAGDFNFDTPLKWILHAHLLDNFLQRVH